MMSDESSIECMESKSNSVPLQAMAQYKVMQRNMGSLDPNLEVNWLKYSDALIKVCSEIDFDSETEDEVNIDGKQLVPGKVKQYSAKRQLDNHRADYGDWSLCRGTWPAFLECKVGDCRW